MIYLDNAATTLQKSESVLKAVCEAVRSANPGRSGHRLSMEAAKIIFGAREAVADLFNFHDSSRVIFTKNATEAINIVIHGVLGRGGHVIISPFEHNAVMRPLNELVKKAGATYNTYEVSKCGEIDEKSFKKTITRDTKLIISTAVSNVTGEIMPFRQIGSIADSMGIPFMLDAAQGSGAIPLDMADCKISALAFTGHKHLFGPQGTGGLILAEGFNFPSFIQGGTGSRSEEAYHPDFMPDALEAGTPNTPGISGLLTAIEDLKLKGLDEIRSIEEKLTAQLTDGLREIEGLSIYGSEILKRKVGIVSFNVDGLQNSDIAKMLEKKYDIMTRPGLHCAPFAHRHLQTFPNGALRLSLSWKNTSEEIEQVVKAVHQVVSELR